MPIDLEPIPNFGRDAAMLVAQLESADLDTKHSIIRAALVKAWNARGDVDVNSVAQLLGAAGAGHATSTVSAPQAARVVRALDIAL